jgi:hypothetical protein
VHHTRYQKQHRQERLCYQKVVHADLLLAWLSRF